MQIFNSIQFLRFIAAAGVVVFHYFGSEYGFQGVQLFFVISGFVILHAYKPCDGTLAFIYKRMSRVFLPYWIVLLATVFFSPNDFNSYDFLMNFVLLDTSPIVQVAWTLTYECIFYCTFAFVTIFKMRKKNLAFCVSGFNFILDFLLYSVLQKKGLPYGFYFSYFTLGMFVYLSMEHRLLSRLDAGWSLFLMIVTMLFFFGGYQYVGIASLRDPAAQFAILAPVGTMIVLFCVLSEIKFRTYIGSALAYFGNFSFAMYLWHHFILKTLPEMRTDVGFGGYFMFVIVTSVLFFIVVERPLNRAVRKYIQSIRSLANGR